MIDCRVDSSIEIEVTANGNLRITVNKGTAQYLSENRHRTDDDLLWYMTEGYWTNGGYEPFDAGQANPFVGLWDGPCIAECMDVADDGTKIIVGRYWAFMAYEVYSFIDILVEKGEVLFHSP